jgi:hypothetical protein
MSDMTEKKLYIWRLATFLHANSKVMSGEELAEHLNRNDFLTNYGTTYQGMRGTYRLIQETWKWLNDDLKLVEEAEHVAMAFVKPDGTYAYV